MTGLHRDERRRTMPLPDATLNAGDVIVLQGPLSTLPARLRFGPSGKWS